MFAYGHLHFPLRSVCLTTEKAVLKAKHLHDVSAFIQYTGESSECSISTSEILGTSMFSGYSCNL